MKLSMKLFLGATLLAFALMAAAMFWGRNVVEGELNTVMEGIGDVETRSLDLENFKGINLEGPLDLILHSGQGQNSFTGPKVILDRYVFSIDDNELEGSITNPFLPKGVRMSMDLYVSELSSLHLSGSVVLSSDDTINISTGLIIWASGNASINLNVSPSNFISANLFGASYLELKGATAELKLDTHGAAKTNQLGLSANTVSVYSGGSSTAKVSGASSLDLFAEGAAQISYAAGDSATVKAEKKGAGEIKPIND